MPQEKKRRLLYRSYKIKSCHNRQQERRVFCMVPETPAQKLKALRIRKGLSMEALANILGIGKTTVAAWESGKSVPSVEKLREITKFYNISTDWIFENELQEKELLRAWRELSPEKRAAILTLITS